MANPLSHGTPEMKHDLRILVIQLLFDINSSDPSRLSLLEVDSEFFEALNISQLLDSEEDSERELAEDLALLLLQHDKRILMKDLLAHDL